MSESTDKTINYFNTRESRWGYKLVLGGTKHFGYYPEGSTKISMKQAMVNMIDELGETLKVPPNSSVLDAGCGEGATAIRLASKYGLNVTGVDLVESSIKAAKINAEKAKVTSSVSFTVGDYTNLDYPDNTFDAIYTLETLVHAPNYKLVLKEFKRVLKPGGKLALFEYTMPTQENMDDKKRRAFQIISEGSAMHSFPSFTHDSFTTILSQAGFNDVKVKNITARMIPMLRRFWQMGVVPYQVIKLAGKQKKYVNTTAGVELYRYRKDFRYNIITAKK